MEWWNVSIFFSFATRLGMAWSIQFLKYLLLYILSIKLLSRVVNPPPLVDKKKISRKFG